ncbi:M20/M25/M40 family metallo-hydrolase, partial [Propionibacterium freudenreichii]|nr:M20/M25/M40 family metallo-hydrolase [Propionibacterium freudenreichii]
GLAAMVIAMIELKAQGLPRKGTLRLLASRAEEVGEYGAKELARAGYMRDADALVVGEPSGWNIIYTHKGSVDFRLRSQGTAAHSSMPEAGFNAIPPLMEVLVRAQQEFNARPASDPVLGELTFSTTVFHGGDQVNTIPDSAVAEVNVRTIPQFDNDEAIALLKGLVGEQNRRGARISLDPYMQEPVVQAPRDSLLVRLATKLGERISGATIPVVGVAGVTDASSLLRGKGPDFPFMMFGPGNETMHTVNENIDKQMYLDFVQLYQRLFVEYLGQAG